MTRKEYDLFEALNNSNAGITFAQLFAISPLLRRLCIKGLKLNTRDIRKIQCHSPYKSRLKMTPIFL